MYSVRGAPARINRKQLSNGVNISDESTWRFETEPFQRRTVGFQNARVRMVA
jgi:hypothetical protein